MDKDPINFFAENTPDGWERLVSELKDDLPIIKSRLEKLPSYFPLAEHIFRPWFMQTPKEIKLVIVSSDPLPDFLDSNKPRHQGLGISQSEQDEATGWVSAWFDALEKYDKNWKRPMMGDLSPWIYREGFFFISMALTRPQNPTQNNECRHHRALWSPVIKFTMEIIQEANPDVTVLLLGKDTFTVKAYLTGKTKIVEVKSMSDFEEYVLKKIEEILKNKKLQMINWEL